MKKNESKEFDISELTKYVYKYFKYHPQLNSRTLRRIIIADHSIYVPVTVIDIILKNFK
jgi:hypothetical protein